MKLTENFRINVESALNHLHKEICNGCSYNQGNQVVGIHERPFAATKLPIIKYL